MEISIGEKNVCLKEIYYTNSRSDHLFCSVFEPLDTITVGQMLNYIISNDKAFGNITIVKINSHFNEEISFVNYRYGYYVDKNYKKIKNFELPEEIKNADIKELAKFYGWGVIDWEIKIK